MPLPDVPALRALWHLPYPLLVLDSEMRLCQHNEAADELFALVSQHHVGHKCGEILRCLHAQRSEDSCGDTTHCPECDIRNGVTQAQQELCTVQARVSLDHGNGADRFEHILVTAVGFEQEGQRFAMLMLQDIPELAVSTGLVPLCASCHRMCDSDGTWHELAPYLVRTFDLTVTHSLCPDCRPKGL